jgi:hypothetical protein
MKPADIESRLRQVAWPAPSIDLRARVLTAVPAASPAVSWSDRVWFSGAWRLAAVAALVVLAALNQLSGPTGPSAAPESPQAVAEARVIEETAQQAGLSPEQAAALARRAAAAEKNARSGSAFRGLVLEELDSGGEPR